MISIEALEARARRAARRAGYVACKSRWRSGSMDNFGGFMIVDSWTNAVVAGARFDMSAEEVIDWCRDDLPATPVETPEPKVVQIEIERVETPEPKVVTICVEHSATR